MHIYSHIFMHLLSSTAVRFCPPQKGLTLLMSHIKPVVRAIEDPTQLFKVSCDEILDLTPGVFPFYTNILGIYLRVILVVCPSYAYPSFPRPPHG